MTDALINRYGQVVLDGIQIHAEEWDVDPTTFDNLSAHGEGDYIARHPAFRMPQQIDLVLNAEKQVRVEGINMWFMCADKQLKYFYKKVAAF